MNGKNKKELNEFMTIKSYEEYKAGPFEKILHKLKDPDRSKNKIYNYQPTLPGIDQTPKQEIKPIKPVQDIEFENFVEQQRQQKLQGEYETNHQGLAVLKDKI
jgi:hypothetical protein